MTFAARRLVTFTAAVFVALVAHEVIGDGRGVVAELVLAGLLAGFALAFARVAKHEIQRALVLAATLVAAGLLATTALRHLEVATRNLDSSATALVLLGAAFIGLAVATRLTGTGPREVSP